MDDPSAFVDWLDSNYDVHEVSGGGSLKVNGECPFCGEDRADLRLYVNPDNGTGICFHCSTSFNPVKFVMAAKRCPYAKAKKVIAGDPNDWVVSKEEAPQEQSVAWPLRTELDAAPGAAHYLIERGVDAAVVKHFGLYFCEHKTPIGDRVFNTQQRVIIPIHDIEGQPVSWIGRSIVGATPKYLFPTGFKGAEILYNAWAIPKGADYLIICEGVMDVFGWWQHGAKNVIATFGKKISDNQMEIIKVLSPKVIFIAWDSDAAWEKYSYIEKYSHLFKIRVVDLGGKDSDECTGQELEIALKTSKGYSWGDKILAGLYR